MKPINVLHIIPSNNTQILERVLSEWQDHFDASRFRIHLASVPFHFFQKKYSNPEGRVPVHRLHWAFGKGAIEFCALLRRLDIHILHTHHGMTHLWSIPLARSTNVNLFAHNYLGTEEPDNLSWFEKKKLTSLKSFQRIAVGDRSLLAAFESEFHLGAHRLFLNPFALPEGFYQQFSFQKRPDFRLKIIPLALDPNIRKLPPAFTLAFQEIRKEYPQSILRFKRLSNSLQLEQTEDFFHLYLLIPGQCPSEKFFLTVLEFISKQIPFIILGHHAPLPAFFDLGDLWSDIIHPKNIFSLIKRVLDNPERLIQSINLLQKSCAKNLRFASHCELWQMHYEEMLEESVSRQISPIKRSVSPNRQSAAAFTDEQFFDLLTCPICRLSLEANVTDRERSQAWQGTLFCSKGHTFPIIRGIPRLFVGSSEAPRFQPHSPSSYWRVHFERDPLRTKNHVRKLISPFLKDLSQGNRVLYLNPGRGYELVELARYGTQIIACAQENEIDLCAAFIRDYPQIRLLQADLRRLPIRQKSIDLCYEAQGNLLSEDPTQEMSEIQHLLKPQGHLHYFLHSFPMLEKRQEDYWLGRKRLLSKIPLPLLSCLALFMATVQKTYGIFRPVYRENFTVLRSLWFRLLAYPHALPVREKNLRLHAQEVGLNQPHLQQLKPWGTHLSGRN